MLYQFFQLQAEFPSCHDPRDLCGWTRLPLRQCRRLQPALHWSRTAQGLLAGREAIPQEISKVALSHALDHEYPNHSFYLHMQWCWFRLQLFTQSRLRVITLRRSPATPRTFLYHVELNSLGWSVRLRSDHYLLFRFPIFMEMLACETSSTRYSSHSYNELVEIHHWGQPIIRDWFHVLSRHWLSIDNIDLSSAECFTDQISIHYDIDKVLECQISMLFKFEPTLLQWDWSRHWWSTYCKDREALLRTSCRLDRTLHSTIIVPGIEWSRDEWRRGSRAYRRSS